MFICVCVCVWVPVCVCACEKKYVAVCASVVHSSVDAFTFLFFLDTTELPLVSLERFIVFNEISGVVVVSAFCPVKNAAELVPVR